MADAAAKEKEKEKKEDRKDAAAEAGRPPLFNKRQWMILGGVLGVWTLVVAGVVWMVSGADRSTDPDTAGPVDNDKAFEKPVVGPTVAVINELHVPYRSQKEGNPIVIVSLALEFDRDWYTEEAGAWKLKDAFDALKKKVTDEANPQIRHAVYDVISSRDYEDLRGPRNKERVESEIRVRVNEILMRQSEITKDPVVKALLTQYNFSG